MEPQPVGAQLSPEWHLWRSACDITASEAHEACGLSSETSRQRWVTNRAGITPRAPPNELGRLMMERGKLDQPWAEDCYAEHMLEREDEALLPEWHFRRAVCSGEHQVYYLGATPDAIVCDKQTRKPLRLLEIKTAQTVGDDDVTESPKPAHVLQTVIQLYCTGMQHAHLFYYRRSSGRYRCFNIRSSDQEFMRVVWPWLAEVLNCDGDIGRMPNGERERRERELICNFVRR